MKANVLVVERNGDWGRISSFYRVADEIGKELLVFAYMAKNNSYPERYDENGVEVMRDNFKRIRNRFLGYLDDKDYDYQGEIEDLPAEIFKLNEEAERFYFVKIERAENGCIEITVEYVETPAGIADDDYADRISGLSGTRITLEVK